MNSVNLIIHRVVLALAASILLALATTTAAHASTTKRAPNTPYGMHSMLYLNSPTPLKRLMFAEAHKAGASWIRVDISLGALENPYIATRMWADVRQYERLARRYHVRVLADLPDTDGSLTDCPTAADPTRCGISDPANLVRYSDEVGQLASRTAGVINDFEIINEPDARWAFTGTPQQYAWMLRTAYDAIHRANPRARVALGGIMAPYDEPWLAQAFATPGANAARAFDIANVHLRARLGQLRNQLASWHGFFARYGDGAKPLWVTETGYASNPAYQEAPRFRGASVASGRKQQAAYISAEIPLLLRHGASKVFVTERNNLSGEAASEGLLGGRVTDKAASTDPAAVEATIKPAFRAYQQMATERASRHHDGRQR